MMLSFSTAIKMDFILPKAAITGCSPFKKLKLPPSPGHGFGRQKIPENISS